MARLITDAGDSGVLLPVTLVCVLLLWGLHARPLAWLLLRSVTLAGTVIAALKLLFLSCAAHWAPGLTSPSGHACLSAVVYGCLATLLAGGRAPAVRVLAAVCLAALVALIAVSRVVLGVHTWPEVLIGLAVGGLAHGWFAWSCTRRGLLPLRVDLRSFGLVLTATVVLAFGLRLPAELFLRHMAKRVGQGCPVVRTEHQAPRRWLEPSLQARRLPWRRL